ncbi:hypothetical protein AJ79_07542 [Helicocarpus griseus UAMH5409]|uniref:Hydrophobin n=1 Tax=Helicocarpus griseus UAMH5409 TaxID=1447875 RepID=A0A2B7X1Y8_9EURO|nr:hypothetical protein AJ79_07542 [Helicocarpus griseus UAMH5409]
MQLPTFSSLASALITTLATAALLRGVSGVWTCPSEREPYCCGQYEEKMRLNGTIEALIGTNCIDAPRNDNCSDAHPVECCKSMRPGRPDENTSYYCDSEAIGYSTGWQS